MNTMFEGAVKVGKAKSIAGLVILSIISIIFIGIAFYLLTSVDKNIRSGVANIIKATCNQVINRISNSYSQSYSCSLDISYIANNMEYKTMIVTNGPNSYLTGGTIPISYDIANPLNVTEKKTSPTLIGLIFLIVGVACLFGGMFNFYLNSVSKEYAAASGVNAIGSQLLGGPILGNPILGNPILGNPILGNPILGNPLIR